jgi:hypothetical protein
MLLHAPIMQGRRTKIEWTAPLKGVRAAAFGRTITEIGAAVTVTFPRRISPYDANFSSAMCPCAGQDSFFSGRPSRSSSLILIPPFVLQTPDKADASVAICHRPAET